MSFKSLVKKKSKVAALGAAAFLAMSPMVGCDSEVKSLENNEETVTRVEQKGPVTFSFVTNSGDYDLCSNGVIDESSFEHTLYLNTSDIVSSVTLNNGVELTLVDLTVAPEVGGIYEVYFPSEDNPSIVEYQGTISIPEDELVEIATSRGIVQFELCDIAAGYSNNDVGSTVASDNYVKAYVLDKDEISVGTTVDIGYGYSIHLRTVSPGYSVQKYAVIDIIDAEGGVSTEMIGLRDYTGISIPGMKYKLRLYMGGLGEDSATLTAFWTN